MINCAKTGMKKITLLLFVAALSTSLAAQETVRQIDALLAAYAKNETFNGTVLIALDGKILLQKGYGYKNAAQKILNDGNTIFQVGSVTKQFTAAVILRLQEQKKLSLQDKLSNYFPELSFAGKITIEQLLSHTSGIFNYTNNGDFMKTEAAKPASQEKILALFKDKPLEFEPGSQFNYSNSGYILLGYIIEKITGKPYYQAVRDMIFTPLHMDHTGFNFAGLQSPDKATGYFVLSKTANTPATIVDSSASFAAGAIYSTAGDLYKWDRSLYTEKIISKASLKNAYTRRKGMYGLGWIIDSANGKEVYQHSGGIFGFTSFIGRSPEEDICIILFDNKGDGGLEQQAAAINAILHHQQYELPKEHIAIQLDSSVLKKYVGEYELSPNFILTVSFENGQLMVQPSGQGKMEMFAEKQDFFFLKQANAQMEFIKDTDGKTYKLIVHQNGQHMPAKKIK
jgi:CubicO group peptidase (beta-lactamase class C family)